MPENIPLIPFTPAFEGALELDIFPIEKMFKLGSDILSYPHKIEFYQLILITEGKGKHFIDFKNYPFKKRTLISIAKNQAQVFRNFENINGYSIVFTEQFLYKEKTDLELLSNLKLFDYYLFSPTLDLEAKDFEELVTIFNQMQTEMEFSPKLSNDEILRSLLKVFILKAERIKSRVSQFEKINCDYEIFLKFKNAIEKQFAVSRQVNDYCNRLSVTYRKLSQVTKNYIGKTPKEFIDERVVLEVKRLLTHTSMSIKEIAYTVGFDEPTNLTKFFKSYTDMAPSSFRHH